MANVSVAYMRDAVSNVYNGRKWKIKVDQMPDRQIMALYYRFYHGGKSDTPEEPKPAKKPIDIVADSKPTFQAYVGEQMRFEGLT